MITVMIPEFIGWLFLIAATLSLVNTCLEIYIKHFLPRKRGADHSAQRGE